LLSSSASRGLPWFLQRAPARHRRSSRPEVSVLRTALWVWVQVGGIPLWGTHLPLLALAVRRAEARPQPWLCFPQAPLGRAPWGWPFGPWPHWAFSLRVRSRSDPLAIHVLHVACNRTHSLFTHSLSPASASSRAGSAAALAACTTVNASMMLAQHSRLHKRVIVTPALSSAWSASSSRPFHKRAKTHTHTTLLLIEYLLHAMYGDTYTSKVNSPSL